MKDVKLYNVMFPFWMLMLLFPITWLFVLPGNFIIDSLVLLILMAVLKIEERKTFYKKHIVKIFCLGLLSDLIGAGIMFCVVWLLQIGRMGDELYLTVPGLLISAVCIYAFNYYISFKHCEPEIRFKLALTFAIATAPYTFLVPSSLLYNY